MTVAYNTSITGNKLIKYDKATKITLTTQCPSRYLIIDLVSGTTLCRETLDIKWSIPTGPLLRDAKAIVDKALRTGNYQKERIVHAAMPEGNQLACNKNMGMASGLAYAYNLQYVTCKKCLKVLRCGTQTTLKL
jgi:hypothetical protein